MIPLIIAICTLSVGVVILGWTTYNLMKKQEKSEDILLGYMEYLDKFSRVIEASNKKLKEVDNKRIFEKDDEVGVIFSSILKIQEIWPHVKLKVKTTLQKKQRMLLCYIIVLLVLMKEVKYMKKKFIILFLNSPKILFIHLNFTTQK